MKEDLSGDAMLGKVREIIAIELQVDAQRVVPDASLATLGMDSIAALNIIFAVEETFGITFSDANEIVKIKTVADVESAVARYMAESGR